MAVDNIRSIIGQFRQALSGALGRAALIEQAQKVLRQIFELAEVSVSLDPEDPKLRGITLNQAKIFSDLRRSILEPELSQAYTEVGVCSLALVPIFHDQKVVGSIEIIFHKNYHRFSTSEANALELIADLLALHDAVASKNESSQINDLAQLRATEAELLAQSSRIKALYEVSRSLIVNMDPALVTLKGLRALIVATKSDAGMGFFYNSRNKKLELVASEGLSAKYVEGVVATLDRRMLVRYSVESKEGLLIKNIQEDKRAMVDIAREEGLKSTIVVPLIFEADVLGAIVVFCREAERYGEADFDLVSAAASQMALALKQAEVYSAERRQADSLGALYRLSHELTKVQSPRDVAEHAFPILQEEFSFKRIWLGVINDQGTHIVGQGGLGPGIRRNVVNLQIELDLRHDFLDQAIRSKQALVVAPGEQMECSGLNRLIGRLKPGAFAVVPLVALGQVVGVFVGEPAVGSVAVLERKLPLLTSMASEIASVILARRFESRLANAEKMRMAGMLASGVAHNFNNMLQAVMGQASLIEMQLPEGSPLRGSAKTIIESANKGAGLVRQLLSFSIEGPSVREIIPVNQLIEESRVLYESLLGSEITVELDLDPQSINVSGDRSQIQQILTNILVNAREAIEGGEGAYVKVTSRQVRLRSGEVDPELAPGQYVRIDIEDDGIGMDEEKQLRCFEPFFTTKNVDTGTGLGFEGTGLGLSTAYSLAKQHDGIITVRSAPNEGSVFSVYLPTVAALAAEVSGQLGQFAERNATPPEAIIFNLEADSSGPVKAALESLGFRITVVSEKAQALQCLSEKSDLIKIMVMDIDRSGQDPMLFIQGLTKEYPKLQILSTSVDDTRWSALLRPYSTVELVEKPIGVWAVHAAAKKISASTKPTLADQVVKEVDPRPSEKLATHEQSKTEDSRKS